MVKKRKGIPKFLFMASIFFFLVLSFPNMFISADTQVEITYLKIDVELMEDRSFKETIDMIIFPKEEINFNLHLPKEYKNLELMHNDMKIEFSDGKTIKLTANELNSIKISYTSLDSIEKRKKDFIYVRELVYPNVKNLIFRIKLPLAYGINNEDISSIIPEPTYLQSDGKRIIVLWEMKSPQTPTMFRVKYNSLVTNNKFDINIFVPFAIFSILLILSGILIFNKTYKNKESELKIPSSLLSEDERIICNILKNEGGTIKQKKLSNLTGFSKAKITKILTNLEKKEVITRDPIGRTFIVTLKKKINH
ncbi:MAG: hypothetical protein BWX56_00408 [Euryarchaeota archaeon ADurb.Bin023]|nr:MAG: hypothetical protein BWX56_00408 [Euryarchaeota archaeon ADurb.Bin023]